jgi:hypothetical protein
MTPRDPQKGGKTSSLAAAKRGRGNVLRRKRSMGQDPPTKSVPHRHKSVPSRHKNILSCTQINLSAQIKPPRGGSYLLRSGYTNKFWGHFVMFSGLLANKNKIPRYEYTKEQPRTKNNFAPIICVFFVYLLSVT